jgi:hypothetical protein
LRLRHGSTLTYGPLRVLRKYSAAQAAVKQGIKGQVAWRT